MLKLTRFPQIFTTKYLSYNKLSTSSNIHTKLAEPIEEPEKDDPLHNPDYFKVHNLFTVKDLFDARIHYGHSEGSLDQRMLPFIYGSRLGYTIFNLDETAKRLRQALNVTAHVSYRGGVILFFLKGAQNSHLVEQMSRECNQYAHTRFWRGGIFTNANKQFGAVTRLPDLCIFLNTMNDVLVQHTAVRDAAKMAIATIGIVDSNCNPNLLTYSVPGNDDTPCAIELYCKLFKEAIKRGREAKDLTLNAKT